jgi:hypothetical protein
MSGWGGFIRGDLLGGDGRFFGDCAGIGTFQRLAVIGNHLPHIGNAFSALGLAPHATEETGSSTHAPGDSLLDLLLIKPVADADIHDRSNPASDASVLKAVENECQSLS